MQPPDGKPVRVLMLVDAPTRWDRRVNAFIDGYRTRGCAVELLNITQPAEAVVPTWRRVRAAWRAELFLILHVLPRLWKLIASISAILRAERCAAYDRMPVLKYAKAAAADTILYYYRGAAAAADASDAIHANDLRSLIFAVALAGRRDIPIFYDSHELNVFRNRPRKSWLRLLANAGFEDACIRRTRRIAVVSEPIADLLYRLYGIGEAAVIENDFHARAAPPRQARSDRPAADADCTIYYFGALAPGRGLATLGAVAVQPGVKAYAVTFGQPATAALRETFDLHAVEIVEQDDPSQLLLPSREDFRGRIFSWCFLEDCCLSYRYALPNKLFQSLELGMPIIAAKNGYLARLVEECGAGFAIDPTPSASQIAALLGGIDDQAYRDMCAATDRLGKLLRHAAPMARVDRCIDAVLPRGTPGASTAGASTASPAPIGTISDGS